MLVIDRGGRVAQPWTDRRFPQTYLPKPMISVVLDTNILHQETLHSRSMHLLARLAADGDLQVFIPDMVRREFLSKKLADSREKLDRAKANLLEVGKPLRRPSEHRDLLNTIPAQLDTLRDKLKSLLEDEFEQWRASAKATILHFDPASFGSLIDDYFNGTGAYRNEKSREDFPDAIISSCICELAKTQKDVFVIVTDGVLRRHLNNVPGIATTTGLKEFLAIEEIDRLVSRSDARTKNVEEIKAYFSSLQFQDNLEQRIFESDDLLGPVYLGQDAIEGTDALAVPGWGASVSEPDHSDVHNISFGDTTFIESGHCSIKVMFYSSCRIDYCADYTPYMALPLDVRDTVGERSISRDGVAELCERREVRLEGFVDLYFPPQSTVAELKIHSLYLSMPAHPIKIELNVEHATILPYSAKAKARDNH